MVVSARSSGRSTLLGAACVLLGLALIGGCTVEDPTFDVDASFDDASVPDAGDAGVELGDCRDDPAVCTDAQFCGPDGACLARDRPCDGTTECGPLDACDRPLVATSTTEPAGACVPRPDICASDAQCPGGRCLAIGICGPAVTRAEIEGRALVPRASCAIDADCGLLRFCRGGVCAGCTENADCPGNLLCRDAQCVEPARCDAATAVDDCFPGNVCNGGRCQRPEADCTPDPEDDTFELARDLADGVYTNLTICGDDEDWYALDVPASHGVEVVLTSTASQANLTAEIVEASGDAPKGTTRLDLPGLSVVRAPADEARTLYVRVYSRDTSGTYRLAVRYEAAQCTSDPVEMVGDDVTVPTNVTFDAYICASGPDRRTFEVEAGDRLELALRTLEGEAQPSASLALFDAAGVQIDPSLTSTGAGEASARAEAFGAAQRVTLAADATPVPTIGALYEVQLVRRLAGRAGVCQSATVVDPTGGPQRVQGDLTSAQDVGRPVCSQVVDAPEFAAAERHDLIFRLEPPTEHTLLRATARPTAGTDPKLALAVLEDCADDLTTSACDAAPFPRSSAAVEVVLEPGEQRFLVVSSDGPAEDVRFELEVEYGSLASFPNDRCDAATPLTETGTRAVLLFGAQDAGTWGARNDDQLWSDDVSSACFAFAEEGRGPDRYYALDLAPDERAAVELTGPLGGMLWTGIACGDMPGTCLQAAVRDFSSPVLRATFTASISGANHIVVVDGSEATDQGRYTLRTIRDAQCLEDTDCQGPGLNLCGASPCRCDDYRCRTAPLNDRCNGAATGISGGPGSVVLEGSTGAASDDYAPSCVGGGQPDVVYSVEVYDGAKELAVRITDATFDPALEVSYEACGDAAGEESTVCVDDVRFPTVLLPEVRIPEPQPGLYFITVDSFAGEGAFTLEVEVL